MSAQEQTSYVRKLTGVAMDTLLGSVGKTEELLRGSSKPLLTINKVVEQEAKAFLERVQNNPEVQQAVNEINSNQVVKTGFGIYNSLAPHLNTANKQFHKHVKPMIEQKLKVATEQAKIGFNGALQVAQQKSKQFMKEREMRQREQQARKHLEA
jgi:hypothetical protein